MTSRFDSGSRITEEQRMKLTRRDVMRMVYQGERPPYVPWVLTFTHEAFGMLAQYYGGADRVPLDLLGGHVLTAGQVDDLIENHPSLAQPLAT